MKSKILSIILVGVSTFTFAQSNMNLGIRAGVLSAGMRGDAVNNLSNLLDFSQGMVTPVNRTGFFAGAYTNIPVSENLFVEPAIYYAQKGYELRGALNLKGLSFLGINAKAQLQSQYIDIPVLLKYNMGGIQLFAGPQVSYLMQADLRTTAGVLGFNVIDKKIDATNQFNRWDAGITAGVGFNLSNNINIMASYDYGLTKVDANRNTSAYNNAIKLGIGFKF